MTLADFSITKIPTSSRHSNSVKTALNEDSELIDSLTWASQHLWCPVTEPFPNKTPPDENEKDRLNTTEDTASTSGASLSFPNTLDESQKRNIANLSNSLSTTITTYDSRSQITKRSSKELLPAAKASGIKLDLLSSFHQLTGMFMCGSLQDDVDHRHTVLKETSKTIDLIRIRAPEATREMVDTLFSMLTIPHTFLDVAAESAISIATFLDQRLAPKDRRYIVQKAEENSSDLISVLSTAYLTSVKSPNHKDPMESLFAVAASSKSIQRKMAKRRATNLAIARCLRESDHWKRIGALDFCRRLFHDDASVENLLSFGEGENLEILVDGLVKRVYDDTVVQDQLTAISILSKVLSLDCQHVEKILEALHSVAFQSKSRDAVIVAADAFCSYVKKNGSPSLEHQRALIGFGTLPQKEVRRVALLLLQSLTNNVRSTRVLNKQDTIDALLSIILHSPTQGDKTIALDIVRQMTRARVHHAKLCNHPNFLNAIVSMVTLTETPDPYATEILVALMLNKDNANSFLRVPQVCKWLKSFTHSHQIGGIVQEQLVSLLLRLMLNDGT